MADPIIITQPSLSPEELDDALTGDLAGKKLFALAVHGGGSAYDGETDYSPRFHIHPSVNMRLVAITSRMGPNEYRFDLWVKDKLVLDDEDPATFDLRALVPMTLGPVLRLGDPEIPPIRIEACTVGCPSVISAFSLTLWGQCVAPTAATPSEEAVAAPDIHLLQTLRALKTAGTPIEDPEVRALLDRYARWL